MEINKNEDINSQEGLQRGLKERHVQLMAIGCAIGVGLFLGSSPAIKLAGPSLILDYALCGLVVFIVMRALGELSIHNPVSGSFARHARDYVSPLAGFLASWNYLYMGWAVCTAEVIAAPVFMQFWFPNTPRLLWSALAFILIVGLNFLAVEAFGEFEFWFALIKIVAIVCMLVMGLIVIFFGIGKFAEPTGISNLWIHGGFFPKGFAGFFLAIPYAVYAYGGSEMVGNTAGEVKNPEKTLAKAINNIFFRILIFYVGSMFVIMSVFPWNQIGGTFGSPFVLVFSNVGIRSAAGIINFVVLTSAMSSFNSNFFAASRTILNLAELGQAPNKMKKIAKNGVPYVAVIGIACAMFIGVMLSLLVPSSVFDVMVGSGSTSVLVTYTIILFTHHKYRQTLTKEKLEKSPYKLPIYPLSSIFSGIFIIISLGVMAYRTNTRIGFIFAIVLYIVLVAIFYMTGMSKKGYTIKEAVNK